MKIQDFIPAAQLRLIRQLQQGEEGQFFIEKEKEIQGIIDDTPPIYSQDGMGEDAVISLHYFGGSYDAWITEVGENGECFGLVSFSGLGAAELGYIYLPEIMSIKMVELDLYFSPKTIKELKKRN